jgi:hypothetical protein
MGTRRRQHGRRVLLRGVGQLRSSGRSASDNRWRRCRPSTTCSERCGAASATPGLWSGEARAGGGQDRRKRSATAVARVRTRATTVGTGSDVCILRSSMWTPRRRDDFEPSAEDPDLLVLDREHLAQAVELRDERSARVGAPLEPAASSEQGQPLERHGMLERATLDAPRSGVNARGPPSRRLPERRSDARHRLRHIRHDELRLQPEHPVAEPHELAVPPRIRRRAPDVRPRRRLPPRAAWQAPGSRRCSFRARPGGGTRLRGARAYPPTTSNPANASRARAFSSAVSQLWRV